MSRWLRALTMLFLMVILASSVLVSGYASDQVGDVLDQGALLAVGNPTSVTIPGSLQDELGCAGDWDPACSNTYLTYDENDDVWQAIQMLSQPLREAIVLRHWADHSFKEIGQISGCSPRTAQSRVRLAHEKLRKRLDLVNLTYLEDKGL